MREYEIQKVAALYELQHEIYKQNPVQKRKGKKIKAK